MFYPTGCFRHSPGLRSRPVPELRCCIVFTPAEPKLFTLNPNAWLILELCDGKTPTALETAYVERVVPPLTRNEALDNLQQGLKMLLNDGIIYRVA